jgi:Mrp family chromosome partitioning ATPase
LIKSDGVLETFQDNTRQYFSIQPTTYQDNSIHQPNLMKPTLIAVTGDKGGVGKSTLTALLAEWLTHQNLSVQIIDSDPNQSTQTWLDKCKEADRNLSRGGPQKPDRGESSKLKTTTEQSLSAK